MPVLHIIYGRSLKNKKVIKPTSYVGTLNVFAEFASSCQDRNLYNSPQEFPSLVVPSVTVTVLSLKTHLL